MFDATDSKTIEYLERRLGFTHAHQRLGMEQEHQRDVFFGGRKLFHLENWYSIHGLIRFCFRVTGLHSRAQCNATKIAIRENHFLIDHLPGALDGFRILHLSDLHLDMYPAAVHALIERLREVKYDLCVMTGDYRVKTFGAIDEAMTIFRSVRTHIDRPVYAVLGNHDSIAMVPALEDMGVQLLLNESETIHHKGSQFTLAGIDDAHFFRVDNIEKAVSQSPPEQVRILLSHTPEIYRQAAHAKVDVLLCGHTHGGQICLPGGIPITLDSRCPRFVGRGKWRHQQMQAYTSVGAGTSIVNLRLNCPPEITVHTLSRGNPGNN